MSHDNIGVVRRMYQAFHRGGAETALSYFEPKVAVDATMRVDGTTGTGHDALGRIIGQWLAAFDEWEEEIEELRSVDDRVVVVATQHGRAKATGVEVQMRYGVVYEVAGGKITRMTLHRGPAEAVTAARRRT